jgi:hypothetical protein
VVCRTREMMAKKRLTKRRRATSKTCLRSPDLDQAKSAVLNSHLATRNAGIGMRSRSSSSRIAQNRGFHLTRRLYSAIAFIRNPGRSLPAPSTCARVAFDALHTEAADRGLLSAGLAAGIRRIKGVKKIGVKLGNGLTAQQAEALLNEQIWSG